MLRDSREHSIPWPDLQHFEHLLVNRLAQHDTSPCAIYFVSFVLGDYTLEQVTVDSNAGQAKKQDAAKYKMRAGRAVESKDICIAAADTVHNHCLSRPLLFGEEGWWWSLRSWCG